MKRSPLKIAMVALAYLAAGAMVNVLVAWGIAAWLPVPSYAGGWRGEGVPASMHMVPGSWPRCERAEQGQGFGRTQTTAHFGQRGYFGNEKTLIHMQTGWPMRSMESWATIDLSMNRSQATNYFGLRFANLPRLRRYPEQSFRRIPLRPDMLGMLINTVLYAVAMFASVELAGSARRTWRQRLGLRRGACPECGYPVGASALCTECGRPVRGIVMPTDEAAR